MKDFPPLAITTTIFFIFFLPFTLRAEPIPILEKLHQCRNSIVSIHAETAALAKGPQSAFIDKESGRMFLVRNVKGAQHARSGAGIIIHSSGIIVTNAHTVKNAARIRVQSLTNTYESAAKIIKIIPQEDLAFLSLDTPPSVNAITFSNSEAAAIGNLVYAIGNSQTLQGTFLTGKITAIGTRKKLPYAGEVELIQTNITIYKGDSGGPLFDSNGNFLGLLTAGYKRIPHGSFAIPSNKIIHYLLKLLEDNQLN